MIRAAGALTKINRPTIKTTRRIILRVQRVAVAKGIYGNRPYRYSFLRRPQTLVGAPSNNTVFIVKAAVAATSQGQQTAKKRPPPRKAARSAAQERPIRALFCLGLKNPVRKLCISIVEWKYEVFIQFGLYTYVLHLIIFKTNPNKFYFFLLFRQHVYRKKIPTFIAIRYHSNLLYYLLYDTLLL